MYWPSFRDVATALLGKLPRPGVGMTIFGARLLIALPFHHMCLRTTPTRPLSLQLRSMKLRS